MKMLQSHLGRRIKQSQGEKGGRNMGTRGEEEGQRGRERKRSGVVVGMEVGKQIQGGPAYSHFGLK